MVGTIPDKMCALVLPSPGKFEIQSVTVPTPGAGEALCRIRAVAICGSDPEIFRGDLAGTWPPGYPFIPGHEWSGEVVATGPGVSKVSVGDRVAGQAHRGCGVCPNCMAGRYTICENYGRPETGHRHYGFITPGAYAQYAVYSEKSLDKMPESVSFRAGALVDTAGVSLHALELTGITPGGSVAVIGPGPIGLLTMRLAHAMGAGKIIAVGRGARLQAASRSFANVLVDIEQDDPIDAVRKATTDRGVDEAMECSGAQGTLSQAIQMVKKGGRIALLGVPPNHILEQIPFKYVVHNEIMITGVRANPNVSRKVLNMIAGGQLALEDLITHTFPLEEFALALETFIHRRQGAIKVIIEPNGAEI